MTALRGGLAGLAVLASLGAAPPAHAQAPLVVRAPHARAVVTPSPFSITFEDARGRTLLRERAAAGRGTTTLPSTRDPEPLGGAREPDNARYAPLTVEVGREQRAQWNAGLWGGAMLFSRRSATVQAARRVVSARRSGRGLRLIVATGDPRRALAVRIDPDGARGIRVRVRPQRTGGVITMGDAFATAPGEHFYGFGGRHGVVDQRGAKLFGWTEQEGIGGEPSLRAGLSLLDTLVEGGTDYTRPQLGPAPSLPGDLDGGFERYLFPGGPGMAYYPQAQFVSSRGYAFLLNQDVFSRWRMADDRADAWQVQASAGRLDYTVFAGPGPARAAGAATAVTGRHQIPPAWAQGDLIWRLVRVPPLPGLPAIETPATYKASIEQDLADFRTHDVQPAGYSFEGWALLDDEAYVRSLIARLHAAGTKAILYHRAYVSDDALSTQPKGDFATTRRLGLVATDATGEPYEYGSNGGGPATLLDMTNPATVRWWKARITHTLDLGADGFMLDFGEQVQDGMHFHDGSTGVTMHNRYPVLFSRVTRRIVDDWTRRHPGHERIWFFTRAGYSGRPGSAAAEMGNFPGDETADWGAASGLRSLAPDMLSRGVGGAFGYATDIGGYLDALTGAADEELFDRWAAWSVLTPYFRLHNSAAAGTRMPWSYGPGELARWKAYVALHRRAVPYMRRLWREGRRTGMPVARPLWLAAPTAPGAATESQEWMLGDDVLVAPVVEQGAVTRAVRLPRGCWQRGGASGPTFTGPATVTVPAPLGDLPYFVRCGATPF